MSAIHAYEPSWDTSTSATSLTIDLSNGVSNGGVFIIVNQNSSQTGSALSLADSSGWNELETGGWQYCYFGIWYIEAGNTIPSSVTINSTHQGAIVAMTVHLTANSSIDAIGVQAGSSSDVSSLEVPGITATADDSDLLLLYVGREVQEDSTISGNMEMAAVQVAWTGVIGSSATTFIGHETVNSGPTGSRTVTPQRVKPMYGYLVALSSAPATPYLYIRDNDSWIPGSETTL
ncbi:MAG: hypothetical protein WD467_03245 [Candidatus Saccharimonadales bacterium]